MDRQLIGRLAIAGITVAAVAATVVILGAGDDSAPAPAAVAAPAAEAPQRAPDRTVTRTLAPTTSTAPAAPVPSSWQITYELTGSGTATVVYDDNGLGLVHQELSVPLPWSKTLTWPKTAVAPTVQLMGQSSGPVECRVSVNGVLARSAKAADGEVATCAGRLS
ncbi:MmpS family transport accessory protein [Amycolatopsis sp. VS8301801F10]|uniref:MmpS family transport accessory protein n=1 Tax=Amycolatopsis sp. VS8301801F10 TaxID=2652442 RepID=UPI0038FC493E